jgi:hypothetical protein
MHPLRCAETADCAFSDLLRPATSVEYLLRRTRDKLIRKSAKEGNCMNRRILGVLFVLTLVALAFAVADTTKPANLTPELCTATVRRVPHLTRCIDLRVLSFY